MKVRKITHPNVLKDWDNFAREQDDSTNPEILTELEKRYLQSDKEITSCLFSGGKIQIHNIGGSVPLARWIFIRDKRHNLKYTIIFEDLN